MRVVLLVLLAAGSLIGADFRDDRIELKSEQLEGTWALHTVEWLGEEADQLWWCDDGPASECVEARELRKLVMDRMTLTFRKHGFFVRQKALDRQGGCIIWPSSWKGVYCIDQTRQPHALRTYPEDRNRQNPLYAIFAVEGDTLKLCFRDNDGDGRPLPRTFSTEKDSDVYLLTFRRSRS
jgi:uncharacterized protein (TIGR03067 family)